MRKISLGVALCLFAVPAFAAPPADTDASLKPGAADLTGPVRGVHPPPSPKPVKHKAAPAKVTPPK